VSVRGGPRYWLAGFVAMFRWQLASLRLFMLLIVAVEMLTGIGLVVAIGLMVPDIPLVAALYATTGAAVVALVLIGLVFGPQLIAMQKIQGTYEYLIALPVARSATVLAWCGVTLVVGLPGAAAAIAFGAWHYGLDLRASMAIVPATLLTLFTATMLGSSIAHAAREPMVTVILSQVLVFLAFGYAPISFPASQMPHWLAEANRGLPFLPMASVVRGSLTHGLVGSLTESYLVLAAWAAASVALATWALGRRR
jgi:ABC-2 type transport system permease protein